MYVCVYIYNLLGNLLGVMNITHPHKFGCLALGHRTWYTGKAWGIHALQPRAVPEPSTPGPYTLNPKTPNLFETSEKHSAALIGGESCFRARTRLLGSSQVLGSRGSEVLNCMALRL